MGRRARFQDTGNGSFFRDMAVERGLRSTASKLKRGGPASWDKAQELAMPPSVGGDVAPMPLDGRAA